MLKDLKYGEENGCELHHDDAGCKPHWWDEPWVHGLECGREHGRNPERRTGKSSNNAQDGLQTPPVSITDISDPVKLVRAVDPGPEQLPESGWNPLQGLATLDLSFVKWNVAIARPVTLQCS